MSLDDYVGRERCWTCALPAEVRSEIDDTRRRMEADGKKLGPDQVIKWLIEEKGYERAQVKRGSLNYHFQQKHHVSG